MTAVIVNADCTSEPPDSGHDVYITDPPFSAHVHDSAVSQGPGSSKNATVGTRKRDLGFDCITDELRRHVARTAAASRRWSVIYSDVESANTMRETCELVGAEYVRTMPWVRWSMPQLSGDRPPQGFEALIVCHAQATGPRGGRKPIAKHWNGPGNLTHLAHRALRGDGKHKCEKPLDQALDLVSYFSDPGECVRDDFAGSGAIGLACAILGRDYVGFEMSAEWAARATRLIGGDLEGRHWDRLREWCERTEDVSDGYAPTEPSRKRAAAREADRERARAWLAERVTI
jgi:hypothetical protein